MDDRALGFDVSHHRPVTDWAAVARSPARFIGIKATEGTSYTDTKLKEHQDGFRRSPLLLGIYYHFARSGDAKGQAQRFMARVGKLEPRERLALDIEVAIADGPARTLDWIQTFFTNVMNTWRDRRPLIYTSKRKWDELVGGMPWQQGSSGVDLWAPRYNDAGLPPKLPAPWQGKGWTIWQHTDGEFPEFSQPGVGECDGNLWRGDEADLRAYAKLVPAPAAPAGTA